MAAKAKHSGLPAAGLQSFAGIGPAYARRLAGLGIESPIDLLFHLPMRYEDRTRLRPIAGLQMGERAVCFGRIVNVQERFGRRRSLLVDIDDDSGRLSLRLFHFSRRQKQQFAAAQAVSCFGEVRAGSQGWEMVHPEYRLQADLAPPPLEARLTPVYHSMAGIGQNRLRKLCAQALSWMQKNQALPELLPVRALDSTWPDLANALRILHAPPPDADLATLAQGRHPAQQRLAFEELLAHRLGLFLARDAARAGSAPRIGAGALSAGLRTALPFELTRAQRRVVDEIAADLLQPRPMLRLIQGDVGSGKTAVAAAAAAATLDSGFQAVLMAPTELLAQQHALNLTAWFAPLGIAVVLLTGAQTKRVRAAALTRISAPEPCVVVGTHALFQQGVALQRVGLVIVDEQHRFGVQQRLSLRDKGQHGQQAPHQLIMTATPIPRTLAQTLYADLDISVIDELPPGRQPVTTVALPEERRAEVVARIHAACRARRQVYWVCPLIEESDLGESAQTSADALQQALPDLQVGLVHGRLSAKQKAAAMQEFSSGATDILVATTVIEVGVDVPNASLMVIENAERLGLSQLHQLRGRVGRGQELSHCVLLYRAPLSAMARARLDTLRQQHDGFAIAQRDLELRGPGELLGARQAGDASFRVADLMRDAPLLPRVQEVADRLARELPEVAPLLIHRWVGAAERFAQA